MPKWFKKLSNKIIELKSTNFWRYKKTIIFSALILIGIIVIPNISFGAVGLGDLMSVLSWILMGITYFLGKILVILINIVINVFSYNNFLNTKMVIVGWPLVRDLCNMFFVVILLMISFGTILNIQSYHFKSTLPKLILAAILVNFSKTILGFCIDFAQVIMLTFVQAFKDAAAINLASGFGIKKMLDLRSDDTSLTADWSVFVTLMTAVVFLVVACGVMLAYAIVLLWRIFTLWGLIVLSPLAFMLGAIPGGGAQKYAGEFWTKFWSQLTTGITMAFFMWLALMVIAGTTTSDTDTTLADQFKPADQSSVDEMSAAVGANASDTSGKNKGEINTTADWDSFLTFLIVIGLLVLALQYAQQAGGLAGEFAGKVSGSLASMGKGAVKLAGKGAQLGGAVPIDALAKRGFDLNVSRNWKKFQDARASRKKTDLQIGDVAAKDRMQKGGFFASRFAALTGGVGDTFKEKGYWRMAGNMVNPSGYGQRASIRSEELNNEGKDLQKQARQEKALATRGGVADDIDAQITILNQQKLDLNAGKIKVEGQVELETAEKEQVAMEEELAGLIAKVSDPNFSNDDRKRLQSLEGDNGLVEKGRVNIGLDKAKVDGKKTTDKKEITDKIDKLTTEKEGLIKDPNTVANYAAGKVNEKKDAIEKERIRLNGLTKAQQDEKTALDSSDNALLNPKEIAEKNERLTILNEPQEEAAKITADQRKKRLEKIADDERDISYYEAAGAKGVGATLSVDERSSRATSAKNLQRQGAEKRTKAAKKSPVRGFELDAASRALESEETSKIQHISESDELIEIAREALASGNHARFTAVAKKLAKDGNNNELLNSFGYKAQYTGQAGDNDMKAFFEDIVKGQGGFRDQEMHQFASELSYNNESAGWYDSSRVNQVKDGRYVWNDSEEHARLAANEVKKKGATAWTQMSRGSFGGENPETGKFESGLILNEILQAFAHDLTVSSKMINEKMSASVAEHLLVVERLNKGVTTALPDSSGEKLIRFLEDKLGKGTSDKVQKVKVVNRP